MSSLDTEEVSAEPLPTSCGLRRSTAGRQLLLTVRPTRSSSHAEPLTSHVLQSYEPWVRGGTARPAKISAVPLGSDEGPSACLEEVTGIPCVHVPLPGRTRDVNSSWNNGARSLWNGSLLSQTGSPISRRSCVTGAGRRAWPGRFPNQTSGRNRDRSQRRPVSKVRQSFAPAGTFASQHDPAMSCVSSIGGGCTRPARRCASGEPHRSHSSQSGRSVVPVARPPNSNASTMRRRSSIM